MRTDVKVALIFLGLLMLVAVTARVIFIVSPPPPPPPPEPPQWITLHFHYEPTSPRDNSDHLADTAVQIAQSRLQPLPAQVEVHPVGPHELDVRLACSPEVYEILKDNPESTSLLRPGMQLEEPTAEMKSMQDLIAAAGGGKGGDPADIVRTLTTTGLLDFRIAPGSTDIDFRSDDYHKAVTSLHDAGPAKSVTIKNISMKWCQVPTPTTIASPQFLVEQSKGETCVLLYDDPAHTILHDRDPKWTLSAKPPRANDSFVILPFDLDPEGTKAMRQLTQSNLSHPLAIIFDGQLLSAPTIQTRIGAKGEITFPDTTPDALAKAQQVQKILAAPPQPITFTFLSQSL